MSIKNGTGVNQKTILSDAKYNNAIHKQKNYGIAQMYNQNKHKTRFSLNQSTQKRYHDINCGIERIVNGLESKPDMQNQNIKSSVNNYQNANKYNTSNIR